MTTRLFLCDDNSMWHAYLRTNIRKRAAVESVVDHLGRRGVRARIVETFLPEFGPGLDIYIGDFKTYVEVRGLKKLFIRPRGMREKEYGEFRNGDFNWKSIVDDILLDYKKRCK